MTEPNRNAQHFEPPEQKPALSPRIVAIVSAAAVAVIGTLIALLT